MSIQGRINELVNRHKRLDDKLEEERKRPSPDLVLMSELKRQKLQIKDEMKALEPEKASA